MEKVNEELEKLIAFINKEHNTNYTSVDEIPTEHLECSISVIDYYFHLYFEEYNEYMYEDDEVYRELVDNLSGDGRANITTYKLMQYLLNEYEGFEKYFEGNTLHVHITDTDMLLISQQCTISDDNPIYCSTFHEYMTGIEFLADNYAYKIGEVYYTSEMTGEEIYRKIFEVYFDYLKDTKRVKFFNSYINGNYNEGGWLVDEDGNVLSEDEKNIYYCNRGSIR